MRLALVAFDKYCEVEMVWDGAAQYWQSVNLIDVVENVATSQTGGWLRIVRDNLDEIRAYYWNPTLSRWEWDGDTAGRLLGDNADDMQLQLEFFAGPTYPDGAVTITTDNFLLWEGCAHASISSSSSSSRSSSSSSRSSSSSSSSRSSSSSSSSSTNVENVSPRWEFVATSTRPAFVAQRPRSGFVAQTQRPEFTALPRSKNV